MIPVPDYLVNPPENPYFGFAALFGMIMPILVYAGASIDSNMLVKIGVDCLFLAMGLFARGVFPNRFDSPPRWPRDGGDSGYVTV